LICSGPAPARSWASPSIPPRSSNEAASISTIWRRSRQVGAAQKEVGAGLALKNKPRCFGMRFLGAWKNLGGSRVELRDAFSPL
jgi:hypothetical protein